MSHQAVDAAYQDQQHAYIQRDQGSRYSLGMYIGFGAPPMEDGREEDEDDDNAELDRERGYR